MIFERAQVNHVNGIPGTAIQIGSLGTFADAQFATDAEQWVDLDPAKGRQVINPDHAIFDRAIVDAGG